MGSGLQTGLSCDPKKIYIPIFPPLDLGEIPSFIESNSYALVFWKKVYLQGYWNKKFGRSNKKEPKIFLYQTLFPVQIEL